MKVQQTVLEESLNDSKVWRRTNTRDALQMLKNVHDELCKAFAVGLVTATTEVPVHADLKCLWRREVLRRRLCVSTSRTRHCV